MTTATFPGPTPWPVRIRRVLAVVGSVLAVTLTESRKHARPAWAHVREHGYDIIGLGCINAAAFVHSTFTGLLVTGASFLVFSWKVNEE